MLQPAVNCLLMKWFVRAERSAAMGFATGGRQLGLSIVDPFLKQKCFEHRPSFVVEVEVLENWFKENKRSYEYAAALRKLVIQGFASRRTWTKPFKKGYRKAKEDENLAIEVLRGRLTRDDQIKTKIFTSLQLRYFWYSRQSDNSADGGCAVRNAITSRWVAIDLLFFGFDWRRLFLFMAATQRAFSRWPSVYQRWRARIPNS